MSITTATQAAEIMNETLVKMGYPDYQIVTTSGTTIEEGFNKIGALPPSMLNSILEQANIVLIFRNYGTMFNASKNKTRAFWRDAITEGTGEEDIYHKIIEAENGFWASDFDGTDDDTLALAVAQDLVKFKKDDIVKKFHTNETKFRLKISVAEDEISKVFTSAGFARYIDVKMANLQWSAEIKLQELVIGAIKQMVDDGKVVYSSGYNLDTQSGVTGLVEALNATSDSMIQPSTALNYAGIKTMSDFEDIYLVTTPEYWNRVKSRGYANAFNLTEYENKNRLIVLPKGTDLGDGINGKPIGFLLVDRRAIVCAMRYWNQMPFIPANTDYKNFFLKIKLILGYNEFFNAVAFECDGIDSYVDTHSYDFITITDVGEQPTDFGEVVFKINGKNYTEYAIDANNMGLQVPTGSFVEIILPEATGCDIAFNTITVSSNEPGSSFNFHTANLTKLNFSSI